MFFLGGRGYKLLLTAVSPLVCEWRGAVVCSLLAGEIEQNDGDVEQDLGSSLKWVERIGKSF